jgi:hypothetical protein
MIMRLLKVLLIILYIPLTVLSLVTLVGLIDRWTNPGHKSISNLDLKQLFFVISINLILIALVLIIRRIMKKLRKA